MFSAKRFLRNREGKSLIKNFIWLGCLQCVNYLLPIITLPYLARVIGVIGFGKVSFAAAVIIWFQAISDWGFNFTATRDVARNRDDNTIISKIFTDVLYARLLLMLGCLILLIILAGFIGPFRDSIDVLLITFLLIPGHILCPEWLFQGLEQMKYITIVNVLSKIFSTILIFIFINNEDDYILQPLFLSLGYLIAGIFSLYIIICKWKINISKPNFHKIWETLVNSADVFINNFMPNLYNSFSVVLLGTWSGSIANGIYDAGSKFINIVIQFIHLLSRVFFPFLSRKINHHKIYALSNLTIVSTTSVILIFIAPWLIKTFFTENFDTAIIVTRILAISLPFVALNNIFGTNYLILIGQERPLRNATCLASFIGFCLAIPLVYFYSYIGAAVTVGFTRALLGILIFIQAKRFKSINKIQNAIN